MKNNPPNVQDEKKYSFTLKNGVVVELTKQDVIDNNLYKLLLLLMGALVVGLFENLAYNIIYTKDFWSFFANKRIGAIFPQIIYFFVILYTAYLMITLYKLYLYNKNSLLKVFLILYYIGFIWSVSVVKYTSPMSYATGIIYNKITHNKWIDTKTQLKLKWEKEHAKNH